MKRIKVACLIIGMLNAVFTDSNNMYCLGYGVVARCIQLLAKAKQSQREQGENNV